MKEKSLFIGSPKYNLVEDFVHHILSGCDVYDGLRRYGKIFYQIFMSLRTIANWEANLHGVEIMPGLDLRRSQRHRRAMTNAVKGNLLDVGQDVLETSINEGTPSIDGVRGRVCRQLERLQLHHLSWRLQKSIEANKLRIAKYYNKKVKIKQFSEGDLVQKVKLSIESKDSKFGKWLSNWEGPYRVKRYAPGNAYILETLKGEEEFGRAINEKYLKYYPSIWINT